MSDYSIGAQYCARKYPMLKFRVTHIKRVDTYRKQKNPDQIRNQNVIAPIENTKNRGIGQR